MTSSDDLPRSTLVGAAGVAVQLATLAVLVRVFEWHYLPATAAAVEAAILNNFVWHQRWTWKDRPCATRQSSALRLVRFHALNGAISLGGNLLLMTLFTGALRLDPIAANAIAIAACSLLNFAASERLVFKAAIPVAGLLILLGFPQTAAAGPGAQDACRVAQLRSGDRCPLQRGVRVEQSIFRPGSRTGRAAGATPSRRTRTRMIKIETPSIDDGKIHHWVGAVFVPGVTLDTVLCA